MSLETRTPVSEASEAIQLQWRVHPLQREPLRLPVVLGAALFAVSVAWSLFRNPLYCLAALFMIASATGEFWLPSRYRLTARGAYGRFGANRFEIEWERVKRVLLYTDGLRLSPLALPSRLDNFRGVYLRFAPDGEPGDRESVLTTVAGLRPLSPQKERRAARRKKAT